jgi:hypothetical protein
MKIKIVILFFFVLYSCNKKDNLDNTLNIKIKYCQSGMSDPMPIQFKLYANDSLLDLIKPRSTSITIDSLKKGNYRIDYRTLFYQDNSIEIDINGFKDSYDVDLCIDHYDHKSSNFKPIVDLLKNNEEYSLELVSHGCEHMDVEKMKVSRTENEYAIKIGDSVKHFKKSELTPLRHFEIELMNIDSASGCTTVDYYTINYEGKETKITDGGCRWNGFYSLKKALGFSQKKQ